MKTLYLFRHAKSDWDAEFGTDFDRPLSRRGRRAAAAMGRFLGHAGRTPELALCSTAIRTTKTLERAIEAGDWDTETEHLDELYTGNTGHLLRAIRAVPKRIDTLMVVGHETAMSETTSLLIGGGHLRFPTAAVAAIELEIGRWKDLAPATGTLLFLVPPRLL
jgi:phosphohistidine phosphatase